MVLKFRIEFAEDYTISLIKNATVNEKLGELSVNVSYIIGIPPVEQTTTATVTSTTPKLDGLFLVFTQIAQFHNFYSEAICFLNQL